MLLFIECLYNINITFAIVLICVKHLLCSCDIALLYVVKYKSHTSILNFECVPIHFGLFFFFETILH